MADRKIIKGFSTETFGGELSITRAEFAAILVRALGLPENSGASSFVDIAARAWYSGAVNTAYEYGLIDG